MIWTAEYCCQSDFIGVDQNPSTGASGMFQGGNSCSQKVTWAGSVLRQQRLVEVAGCFPPVDELSVSVLLLWRLPP